MRNQLSAQSTIRRARASDAEALVRVHNAAWREAYGHLGPEELFATREAKLQEDVAARRCELERGTPWTVAVGEEDQIIGLALAGSCRDVDREGYELYVLYVLRSAYGSGAGQALLEEVIGAEPASLWVLEDNPRALAFYRRNGFHPDGTRKKVADENSHLLEIRIVRPKPLTSI